VSSVFLQKCDVLSTTLVCKESVRWRVGVIFRCLLRYFIALPSSVMLYTCSTCVVLGTEVLGPSQLLLHLLQ